MALPCARTTRALPPWFLFLASAAVIGHLVAVVVRIIAAPSGPWSTPFGNSLAEPPAFAQSISQRACQPYLALLKLDHSYHSPADRPESPAAYFEVRLRDPKGRLLRTVRVPDDAANFWVRHRQTLLAQALANDQPVTPRAGEVIAAPSQAVRTVAIWDLAGDRQLRLRPVPEHLIPRDRPVFRPSEWSLVLARSYVRYLCRVHGAASGELIRHTREPVLPAVLFLDEPSEAAFGELISNFGELPR
jgi:hypothetical protein